MNAKTSCFNKKIFTKNLWQALPFLLLMTFILLMDTLPDLQSLFNSNYQFVVSDSGTANMVKSYMQETVCDDFFMVLLVFYSFCCGVFLFRYLFSQRQCKTMHALPLSRNCLYITNICSGIVLLVLPLLFTALCDGIYIVVKGFSMAYVLPWLGVALGFALFFYALTIFTIMLTGHIVALPILYAVLNFGYYILENIILALFHSFTYGLSYSLEGSTHTIFSPFIHLYDNLYYDWTYQSYNTTGIHAIIIYAVVAVVLLIPGLFLYRKRPLEAQGDPIIFRKIQPVFHYLGTLLCGSIIAILLSELIYLSLDYDMYMTHSQGILILVLFLIGSIFSYYVIKMLLQKTVHVFKTGYIGLTIYLGIVTAAFLCVFFDVFGVEQRIPKQADITSVDICADSYTQEFDDKQLVSTVLDTHKLILDNKEEIIESVRDMRDYGYTEVTLLYHLKGGKTLSRTYQLPLTALWISEDLPDYETPKSVQRILEQLEALFNDIPNLTAAIDRITGKYQLDTVDIYQKYSDDSGETDSYYSVEPELQKELFKAVREDIKSGALKLNFYHESRETDCGYSISIGYFRIHSNRTEDIEDWYCMDFNVTDACEHVLDFIDRHWEPTGTELVID